jgi:peptidoglycan/xylan/chitin deacetylase (PgdA/CDA1 family)
MYHQIADGGGGAYAVPPAQFREQIAVLQSLGAVVRDVGDLVSRRRCGDPLPPGYCIITFDDGHASNLAAAEFLASVGLHASFFVLKEHCAQRPDYLKAADLVRIRRMGHSIGIHGKTHDWWTSLPDDRLKSELNEVRTWLEDLLGEPVETCSAPGGKINRRVRRVLLESDFAAWCTSWCSMNRAADKSREINRAAVQPGDGPERLRAMVRGDRVLYMCRQLRAMAVAAPKFILGR